MQSRTCRTLTRRAFSLMELMVVIIIMGLVIGVVGPALKEKLEWNKWKMAVNECKIIHKSAESFYLDTGKYPRSIEDLKRKTGKGWKGPYIDEAHNLKDPWDVPYRIESNGSKGIRVVSYGSNKSSGGSDHAADVDQTTQP